MRCLPIIAVLSTLLSSPLLAHSGGTDDCHSSQLSYHCHKPKAMTTSQAMELPQSTDLAQCEDRIQIWMERACDSISSDVEVACSVPFWCFLNDESRQTCASFPRWWRKCC